MKLFYAPHACSLSPHIVLRELQLPFELIRVDNRTKRTATGENFLAINPKGYVAALQLDGGEVITEGPAIVQYLADLRPESGLAPANGTLQRVRLQEWLSFINSELHAGMNPLFNKALPVEVQTLFRDKLSKRFDYLVQTLERQPYLLGETFSVADAYLFTVLGWTPHFAIDLHTWPALKQFMVRVGERASVKAAIAAENE